MAAKLTAASSTVEEREQWTRQMIDGIAAAVQSGTYPKGIDRLTSILADVRKTPGSDCSWRKLLPRRKRRGTSSTSESKCYPTKLRRIDPD